MYNGFGGFFYEFGLFGVIWCLMALFIFSVIVLALVRSVGQWKKDNDSPRLTVPAWVVTKRMQVGGSGGGGHSDTASRLYRTHRSHWTYYYATFQVDSGDRMELRLTGPEYGQLAEGDRGSLTFQGSRYIDFKRG